MNLKFELNSDYQSHPQKQINVIISKLPLCIDSTFFVRLLYIYNIHSLKNDSQIEFPCIRFPCVLNQSKSNPGLMKSLLINRIL